MMDPGHDDTLTLHAALERDARLMRELRQTEAWDCLCAQIQKMEARALRFLMDSTCPPEQVGFWRGQIAILREVQVIPDLIIGWFANLEGQNGTG